MRYLFESENLRFRRFEIDDANGLYTNHLEEEIKQWIPNESYADITETKCAIEFYMDCVNRNQLPFVLAIELKENKDLIGDIGVNEVEGNKFEVEIGYTICSKYSNKGFATEAAIAMTNYISGSFGIKVLYGRVMNRNLASIRIMENIGYKFIKEEFGAEDDPYGKGMLIYKKEI